MKKMFPMFILPVILFMMSGHLFSQTPLQLSGTVSDSTKPLGFATVRIFKINNTKPLQTALSNEQGRFQFNKPDTGNYILSFSHTGYTEKKVNITVTTAAGNMQIDPVQLSKTTGMMKEVVVTSQRP